MSSLIKASIFYAIVLTSSVLLALFVAPMLGHATLLIVMTTPLFAVLIMKLLVTREGWRKDGWGDLGLFSLGFSAWPIAIVMPVSVLLFSYGIIWISGIAGFAVPDGYPAVLPIVGLNVLVAFLFCFGEEIGWRGYLLPKLMPLGPRAALFVSGFMQALWHTPFMLFTALYHGGGSPWITIPLFLVGLTFAGVLFGYLRLNSGSVWPAVIAHWVFNVAWGLFTDFTTDKSALSMEYLAGETGVLSLAVIITFAVIFLRRYEKRPIDQRVAYA